MIWDTFVAGMFVWQTLLIINLRNRVLQLEIRAALKTPPQPKQTVTRHEAP